MKLNKKYMTITALLSATAMASAFATSTTQNTTVTASRASHRRGSHSQVQSTEQKAQMVQALAQALGTTPEAITAQLQAGKKPQDIIKASGLDVATVRAQLEASHEADMQTRLQAEVTSGKVTQAHADAMVAGQENHEHKGIGSDMILTQTASILGTTKENIQAQLTSGKTIRQIIAATGISEADFRTKIKAFREASMKTKLEAKVTAGTLTQVQADRMITSMANHAESHGHFGKKRTATSTVAN